MNDLIQRIQAGETGLPIEVEIELALFQPCAIYAAVTANAAKTKLRYVGRDGNEKVNWPQDWCHDRSETITLLKQIKVANPVAPNRQLQPCGAGRVRSG